MNNFFQLEGGGLWINLENVVSVTFNDPGYTLLLDTGSKYVVRETDIEHFEKSLKKFNVEVA